MHIMVMIDMMGMIDILVVIHVVVMMGMVDKLSMIEIVRLQGLAIAIRELRSCWIRRGFD